MKSDIVTKTLYCILLMRGAHNYNIQYLDADDLEKFGLGDSSYILKDELEDIFSHFKESGLFTQFSFSDGKIKYRFN